MQRIFKHSDIRYTIVTPDKILNSLVYRTLFYVNIYGSFKLSKKQSGFLAHPVDTMERLRENLFFSLNDENVELMDCFAGQSLTDGLEYGQIARHQIEPRQTVTVASFSCLGLTLTVIAA